MFCYHLSKNPLKPSKSEDVFESPPILLASLGLRGIASMWIRFSTHRSLGELLSKAWPQIEKWLEYFNDHFRINGRVTNPPLGTQCVIFQGAMTSKHAPSKQYFEKRVPAHLAKLCSIVELQSHPGNGDIVSFTFAQCLSFANDPPAFITSFLEKAGMSNKAFVEALLERGKALLEIRDASTRFAQLTHITHIFAQFGTTLPNVSFHSIWETTLVDGGIPFMLKVFKTVADEALLTQSSISVHVTDVMSQCIVFFSAALEFKAGFPLLVRILKGGFLSSYSNCSPFFDKLPDRGRKASKIIISEQIPAYLAFEVVVKSMASAMERLDIEITRESISRSSIQDEWEAVEILVLERLICKRFNVLYPDADENKRCCVYVSSPFDHAVLVLIPLTVQCRGQR